ncbi:hypothetical protein [Aldersonia kunmingensis]|uniref:hypothetical protein n=1 Tax=Aldersonia kunmingensis TaxID=408066 RepID=UPI0008328183|nr:hypothetical protein [Aldersonia kunmingensis]
MTNEDSRDAFVESLRARYTRNEDELAAFAAQVGDEPDGTIDMVVSQLRALRSGPANLWRKYRAVQWVCDKCGKPVLQVMNTVPRSVLCRRRFSRPLDNNETWEVPPGVGELGRDDVLLLTDFFARKLPPWIGCPGCRNIGQVDRAVVLADIEAEPRATRRV